MKFNKQQPDQSRGFDRLERPQQPNIEPRRASGWEERGMRPPARPTSGQSGGGKKK